ncbi:MAG: transcription termination/antitermination protein NusA [Chloroflexi bacterium]|nr:transcription termination/antitermination protein NusA [Chloroflexota bacterium]MBT4072595.1 transcription termination/antitermination protein NusA [Chloroflexota bacterium]MBT6681283.1 transcription termination/antitermination protein NusA [Chloroflexota bacterium]
MKSDLLLAVTQLAAERALPHGAVLSAIQEALVSAYKRDAISEGQDVTVVLDPDTGEMEVHTVRTVVEDGAEMEEPAAQIFLADALKIDSDATVGQYIQTGTITQHPGRIAAQTAKQVVMQRLREAERELVFDEFEGKAGEVLTVTVQRGDARGVVLDVGRAEAIMPPTEQVPSERYRPGFKVKVYIVEVARTVRGPEIIASRTHPDLIRRLFEAEVPEIFNGIVEIKNIAREPGARSKVAVQSHQAGVDAVGACVGLRGIRIQNVVSELHGEKIDVVEYAEDISTYIANSLSPAQVDAVILDEEERSAVVVVPDRALSLAIGREGQNARLAAKLTDWRVDIKSAAEHATPEEPVPVAPTADAEVADAVSEIVAAVEEAPVTEAEPEEIAAEATEVVETPVAEPVAAEVVPEVEVAAELTPEMAAVAELTTEPVPAVAEQPAAVLETAAASETPAAPKVQTPEEILALQELEQEITALEQKEEQEAAAAAEADQIIDFGSDDIWQLPSSGEEEDAGSLRFAEDIIGYRDQGGSRRRGRGRRGGENLSAKARRAVARKTTTPPPASGDNARTN